MTRHFLAVAVTTLLFTAAYANDAMRLSEPVATTDTTETFGSALDESAPLVELADVGAATVGKTVRIESRVSQVCQKKGCFFIAIDGDTTVRVSFKDYGFFVPTDISGKRVTFVGEVVEKEVTKEEAEHLADDMGEASAAVAPGKTYEIVATSVRLPRG